MAYKKRHTEEWKRPELRGEKLETQAETAERTGKTIHQVRAYVRDYPNEYPEPVLLVNSRMAHRSVKELDAFFEWLHNRPTTRSSGEVAKGEVVRLERAVEKAAKSVETHTARLAVAERELARLKISLRKARDEADLLNQGK